MAFSEVHHVALTVSDMDQSLAFFCELLGFRKTLDMQLSGASFKNYSGCNRAPPPVR